MCGIAGVIQPDPRGDASGLSRRLMDALAHRGPDGEGLHLARGRSIALGHKRLSIVDVEGGAQPMANEDGRVWVVFNGELYNHADLRRELERSGEHEFRTRSDTEVLLHGWEAWGAGLLERLNGIYAFALLDSRGLAPTLCLARDPVGVKPLFVGRADGVWWFASELSAARSCGLLGSTLRPDAFAEYLLYRFVPSPGTFHENAWKVPPGNYCILNPDSLPTHPEFKRFRTRFSAGRQPTNRKDWEEALRSGLAGAVDRQLMSDVPVGTLLSGGVDSTAITQRMAFSLPTPPSAFAVGFPSGADELGAARKASSAIGVPLTEVAITEADYLAEWPRQVAA
ncbi:MAG TPA: asparagine synthase (glutamine-hydrolyzing), partial [Gemmatimonadales bacterium]|nr:asparagine synthase (glutamine-hydrolyzing) [Gemmatimonadales bacterium]